MQSRECSVFDGFLSTTHQAHEGCVGGDEHDGGHPPRRLTATGRKALRITMKGKRMPFKIFEGEQIPWRQSSVHRNQEKEMHALLKL